MTKKNSSPFSKTLSLNGVAPEELTQLQQKLQQLKDHYTHQGNLASFTSSPLKKDNSFTSLTEKEHSSSLKKDNVLKIQQEAKRKRFHQLKIALKWLQETYPLCFKKDNPLPLKKQIDKDIFSNFPQGLPFSKVSVRQALHYYTAAPQYKKNLMAASYRYNLQGEAVQEITSLEHQLAQDQLNQYLSQKKNQIIASRKPPK